MSIDVQSIAKDCTGNNRDDDGKILDPITLDPLTGELVTLVKIGNKCYNRLSLRDFLLSKDAGLAISLDDGTTEEWVNSASGIIEDPFTRQPFPREILTKFHELLSNNRSRMASPSGTSLNEQKLVKFQWKKGGRMKKSTRKKRSNKRSRKSRRRNRSRRRSNKKRK